MLIKFGVYYLNNDFVGYIFAHDNPADAYFEAERVFGWRVNLILPED